MHLGISTLPHPTKRRVRVRVRNSKCVVRVRVSVRHSKHMVRVLFICVPWFGFGEALQTLRVWRCQKHLDTALKARVSVGGEVKVR